MTKHLIYILTALSIAGCSSDSATPETARELPPENRQRIVAEAQEDAAKVAAATDERQRESAILEIKANESRLRSEGFDASADLYISSSRAALDSIQ